jgi:hypothetical protein
VEHFEVCKTRELSLRIQRLPVRWRQVAGLPLLWLVLAALPVVPFALGTGIDASWNYALNIAHAKGVPFGTHLFFTMGPLGYLATPDPGYTGMGAVLAFITATYLLLVYGILRYAWISGIGVASVSAAVLVTQVLFAQHFPDVWQAAYMSVFLAAAASSGRSLTDLALSGSVAGFTLLFKVNEGITACAIFACLIAYSIYRNRAGKVAYFLIAPLPLLILLVGMRIIQGSWISALPYVRNSLDVIGGFSRAASMPGPVWQSGLAVVSVLLIFAAAILLNGWAAVVGPGFVPALLIAFTAFKHGMVRQDGHADMVEVKIAIAALFLMVASAGSRGRRVIGAMALFGAGFTIYVVSQRQWALYRGGVGRVQASGIVSSIRALATFDQHWKTRKAVIDSNLQPLRLDERFSRIIGAATVDAFPENIDVIRANGWNYQPRPGIQSSASFTPRLDAINAEYLEKGPASEYVLFVWFAIDGRHPFLQDPRTLLALLNHYDIAYADDKALLLRRRSTKRFLEPKWIGSAEAYWRHVVTVPTIGPGEALLAQIEVAPSLWGGIRAFLFRASPVYVQVNYRSGLQGFDRVVSANLASGAILSPLPHNLSDFLAFLEGRASPDPVLNVEWVSPGLLEYRSTIRMSWYRLQPVHPAQPVTAQNTH